MKKIELTIPLRYNDGIPIEQSKLDKIKRELIRQFGGLSISAETDGFWTNDNITYNDYNKIYTVITEFNKDIESWITDYKKWLEFHLEQKEIFIVISDVNIVK